MTPNSQEHQYRALTGRAAAVRGMIARLMGDTVVTDRDGRMIVLTDDDLDLLRAVLAAVEDEL